MVPGISVKFGGLQLDTAKIQKELDRAERRSMTQQLGFIRTRARSSDVLRRRKRVSKQGERPSIHSTNRPNLRSIFYNYYPTQHYGVVGPIKFNSVQPTTHHGTGVPNVLEHGGTYKMLEIWVEPVRDRNLPGRWRRPDYRSRRRWQSARKRWRRVVVKPRPFMQVALDKEIESGNIMVPWQNSFGA